MKIVNRETFLAMPPETVFSKYEPCVFEELQIKGETCVEGGDFFYSHIVSALDTRNLDDVFEVIEQAEKNGECLSMDFESQGRDGLFDGKQLFAVWERSDIEGLIERLNKCLKD